MGIPTGVQKQCMIAIQVNLIKTLSLGSMETVKVIILGTLTWPCYIENRTIVRHVIMKLNCTSLFSKKQYYNNSSGVPMDFELL